MRAVVFLQPQKFQNMIKILLQVILPRIKPFLIRHPLFAVVCKLQKKLNNLLKILIGKFD